MRPCRWTIESAAAGGPGSGGEYEAQGPVGQKEVQRQQPQVQTYIAEVQLQGPEGPAQGGGEGQEHPGAGRSPALPGEGYKGHEPAEDRLPQGGAQKGKARDKDQHRIGGAQQRRHEVPQTSQRQGTYAGGTQAQKVIRQKVR